MEGSSLFPNQGARPPVQPSSSPNQDQNTPISNSRLLQFLKETPGGKEELTALMNRLFQGAVSLSNRTGEQLQNLSISGLDLESTPPKIFLSQLSTPAPHFPFPSHKLLQHPLRPMEILESRLSPLELAQFNALKQMVSNHSQTREAPIFPPKPEAPSYSVGQKRPAPVTNNTLEVSKKPRLDESLLPKEEPLLETSLKEDMEIKENEESEITELSAKEELFEKAETFLQSLQDICYPKAPRLEENKEKEDFLFGPTFEEEKKLDLEPSEKGKEKEISICFPFEELPEEIFQLILAKFNKKEDIFSFANTSKNLRGRVVFYFAPHHYGSKVLQANRIFQASTNLNLRKEIQFQLIDSPVDISDLFWINDRVVAGHFWKKQEDKNNFKLDIFHQHKCESSLEVDFSICSMKVLDYNKLYVSVHYKGYNADIIYDFSQRKILEIFIKTSDKILSDEKLLIVAEKKMQLVSLEKDGISEVEWDLEGDIDIEKAVVLSENRVIFDDKNQLSIFDFSCKKIYPIPHFLFPNSLFSKTKGRKIQMRVCTVNKNEIIIQVGVIPALFKIAIPDDLDKECLRIIEYVELEEFLQEKKLLKSGRVPLGGITVDLSHHCLWALTISSKGILKINLNNLSSYELFSRDQIKDVPGEGHIKIIGNTLLRMFSRSIHVWEIKDSSLEFLYAMTHFPKMIFNKSMTSYAYVSNGCKVAIKDYAE